jgi:hypothetical protein
MAEEQTKPFGNYVDLDAFIPPVEPSWITLNGKRYDVVDEIPTSVYFKIVGLSKATDKAADETLISIFQEAIPSLPREIIEHMTSNQLNGCLKFLIELYLKGASDPNLLRPMLKS